MSRAALWVSVAVALVLALFRFDVAATVVALGVVVAANVRAFVRDSRERRP